MLIVMVILFINTPTTEIYTLSLHDALPIAASAVGHPDLVVDAKIERAGDSPRGEVRAELRVAEEPGVARRICRVGTTNDGVARRSGHRDRLRARGRGIDPVETLVREVIVA